MPALVDITGQKFGRWTVLCRDTSKNSRDAKWRSRCQCGTISSVLGYNLRSGGSLSCGCLNREVNSDRAKHGGASLPEYKHWSAMKSRCYNENNIGYPTYGAAGVRVCDRWLKDFGAFYKDMGPRPSPGKTVDRIDPYGNYEPGNCRWASVAEQARNRKGNRFVVYCGVRMIVADAVKKAGSIVPVKTASARIKNGWDVALAVETPVWARGKSRREIVTSYVNPPIPLRQFDYEAIFDGDEGDEFAPRGFGSTEAEARQDLIDNCDEDESDV